jgi:hypothetical protein
MLSMLVSELADRTTEFATGGQPIVVVCKPIAAPLVPTRNWWPPAYVKLRVCGGGTDGWY